MFPGTVGKVTEARAFARSVLADHVLVEDAELVVSELATNAVQHSKSGEWSGPFIVAIDAAPDHVTVSVADLGTDDAPALDAVAVPRPELENGRGLFLVAAVAKEWGYAEVPAGLRVWAELVADTAS